MDYSPRAEDVKDEDGNITRESVQDWLDSHAGDFQTIDDFRADIADGDRDVIIEWATEDGEMTYSDCMFGDES
jgi:hypothetical protein